MNLDALRMRLISPSHFRRGPNNFVKGATADFLARYVETLAR